MEKSLSATDSVSFRITLTLSAPISCKKLMWAMELVLSMSLEERERECKYKTVLQLFFQLQYRSYLKHKMKDN